MRRPDLVAVRLLEPLGRRRVEPLRLAGLRPQLLLCLAELDDLAVSDLERLEQLLLGHLVGAGLDHRQTVLGADDDQVELGRVLGLLERRVDDELAVEQPHADGPDRAEEGQRRDGQRRGDRVDGEDVVCDDEIGREDRRDALHFVAVALRPERPNRAVGHAGGQDRALGRAPFALEEPARDLPGRVHALLDVDGEREEVRAFARFRPALGGAQHHRLACSNDDGAVGLLGQLAGLERDLLAADVDGHGNRHPGGVLGLNNAHRSLFLHCAFCCFQQL